MADCMNGVLAGGSSRLHLLTYLSPDLPFGMFQTYQYFLEEILGCESYLSIESRWHSPPKGKDDPFTLNDVDIAFMCSTGYVRMCDEHNEFMELLPVAPVYDHANSKNQPVYYSEVIVNQNKGELFKSFEDLRGHRWAANDSESLTGNIGVLAVLRKLGHNASFFAQLLHTKSHKKSIKAVLDNMADAAAIDSNVMQIWRKENPQHQDKLRVLCSWGPYPVQPIIINKRMPAATKEKIISAFLDIKKYPTMEERFLKFGIKGFVTTNDDRYNETRRVMRLAASEQLYPAYY